ncbi:MAG: hypothetical protein H7Y89_04120 [Steroidobacteraceae bacterium]|nr:hypothetical protein [Steroidobacteraceae bacterium]
MKVACFVLCLTIAASAGAQERAVPRVEREQHTRDLLHMWQVMTRAKQRVPVRRDSPLRELNLSDEEVREIQAATKSYLPADYLNISPVVTGCACEDGPDCKEQVYVLADAGTSAKGLQLSRIKNAWTVGVLQQWWLNLGRLEERRRRMDYPEYERALIALAHDYPMCAKTETIEVAPKTARASDFTK